MQHPRWTRARRVAALIACVIACTSCGSANDRAGKAGYGAPLDPESPWPKFRRDLPQTARASHATSRGGTFWSFRSGKGVFSSPIIDGQGNVYIGSADRNFYAIDARGQVRYAVETGEIIDSAGLLDDRERVYFGSGDGRLRAIDRRDGRVIWSFAADDPEENHAFINWFEGNVAIDPQGNLYAGNDNYFMYKIDRNDGALVWKRSHPEQNWSLPAIDAATGQLFFGNDNVVAARGDNVFAYDAAGNKRWSEFVPGTVAASPMIDDLGHVVVGAFDGYVRAHDAGDGREIWRFGARDHVYASAAQLPDGGIVVPAADGTIYALEPADGRVRWAFDTGEAVRSSPAVDADGRVYVGGGDGRLYVLEPDGRLRFALRLVDEARNDLNASPALGPSGVVIAGESGEIFHVPYDYCLAEGAGDARCTRGPGEDLPAAAATFLFTDRFGGAGATAPAAIAAHEPLAFSLVVRSAGDTQLAFIDAGAVTATVVPPAPLRVEVSGDRRFLTVTPLRPLKADGGGTVTLTLRSDYLVDADREGLKFGGGRRGGVAAATFAFTLHGDGPASLPLPAPATAAAVAGVWELRRLAAPLPTMLPSYNQIGFDSLHFLVGLLDFDAVRGTGIAWFVGAERAEGEAQARVDAATGVLFPLAVSFAGGRLGLLNEGGMKMAIFNTELAFDTFRVTARLDATGAAVEAATVHITLVCGDLNFFAPFLRDMGLCNPQTDGLLAFGAADLVPYGDGTAAPPAGLGSVTLTRTSRSVIAQFDGSSVALAEHRVALALADADTGAPVAADYNARLSAVAAANGTVAEVRLDLEDLDLPVRLRAYAIVDTVGVARADFDD